MDKVISLNNIGPTILDLLGLSYNFNIYTSYFSKNNNYHLSLMPSDIDQYPIEITGYSIIKDNYELFNYNIYDLANDTEELFPIVKINDTFFQDAIEELNELLTINHEAKDIIDKTEVLRSLGYIQ